MAERLAEFIAKASANAQDVRNVSEENEKNAEDIKDLSESDQEIFQKVARQGALEREYSTKETTPTTHEQEDTVSIERTTRSLRTKSKKKLQIIQKERKPQSKVKKNNNLKKQKNQNVLREQKGKRIGKKRQYWQQKKKGIERETEKEAVGEIWQTVEKNWQERKNKDNDQAERQNETNDREKDKRTDEKQDEKPEENKYKRQKWVKVKAKSKKQQYWGSNSKPTHAPKPDRQESVQIFEAEHEEINPVDYETHNSDPEFQFNKADQDNNNDEFKEENKPIRQRNYKDNRESYYVINDNSKPKINAFNIDHTLTTEKERNEFDQYDNLKYKEQYYPRSQLAATSGDMMLPKLLENTKSAVMPAEPLKLPKVEPQNWWSKEKEVEAKENVDAKQV